MYALPWDMKTLDRVKCDLGLERERVFSWPSPHIVSLLDVIMPISLNLGLAQTIYTLEHAHVVNWTTLYRREMTLFGARFPRFITGYDNLLSVRKNSIVL